MDLCAHYRTRSVIEIIIVEAGTDAVRLARVLTFEMVCPEIMLAHEKGLQRRKRRIFIRPDIAGYEETGGGIGLVLKRERIERQHVSKGTAVPVIKWPVPSFARRSAARISSDP